MLPTTRFSNLRRFTRIAQFYRVLASYPGKVLRISPGRDSRCFIVLPAREAVAANWLAIGG
jgi:hypothetical protein